MPFYPVAPPSSGGGITPPAGDIGGTTADPVIVSIDGSAASGQYARGNGTDLAMSAIQAADVPTLNQNTTGTAGGLSSTLAIASGGTGQTTQQAAMNALAGAVTSGEYLRGNGANMLVGAIQAADVPTLNQNTTGSSGSCTGNAATASSAAALSALTTEGDLLYEDATPANARLPIGSNGQVLTVVSGLPAWAAASGGLSELFKFYSASVASIANGHIITGCSYEITANSMVAGSSFRLVVGSSSTDEAGLYADTTAGTEGTSICTMGTTGYIGPIAILDFVCITGGSSGVLAVNGFVSADISISSLHNELGRVASAVLSVNLTNNLFIELFNVSGSTATFDDVYMIATQT